MHNSNSLTNKCQQCRNIIRCTILLELLAQTLNEAGSYWQNKNKSHFRFDINRIGNMYKIKLMRKPISIYPINVQLTIENIFCMDTHWNCAEEKIETFLELLFLSNFAYSILNLIHRRTHLEWSNKRWRSPRRWEFCKSSADYRCDQFRYRLRWCFSIDHHDMIEWKIVSVYQSMWDIRWNNSKYSPIYIAYHRHRCGRIHRRIGSWLSSNHSWNDLLLILNVENRKALHQSECTKMI